MQAAWTERMRDTDAPWELPADWDRAVGGYLDVGDPVYAWTAKDWAAFSGNRKLPIVAASRLHDWDAGTVARAARQCLATLGVPHGTYTVLDIETQINPVWVEAYGDHMHRFGYKTWVCGSASTLFHNPPLNGYMAEAWVTTGPYMYDHQDVRVTQYASPEQGTGGNWDSSTVVDWVYYSHSWWR